MSDARWADDSIQFPRLLCEILATQENLDVRDLADSMDLEPAQVIELFDRAHEAWEAAKVRTARDILRQKMAIEQQRGAQEKQGWMAAMREVAASIEIPDEVWEVNDGAEPLGSRLAATLYINQLAMHLEAWEVTYDETNRVQVHEAYPDDLENLHAAVAGDGSFQTLTINGREYVIVASPFC